MLPRFTFASRGARTNRSGSTRYSTCWEWIGVGRARTATIKCPVCFCYRPNRTLASWLPVPRAAALTNPPLCRHRGARAGGGQGISPLQAPRQTGVPGGPCSAHGAASRPGSRIGSCPSRQPLARWREELFLAAVNGCCSAHAIAVELIRHSQTVVQTGKSQRAFRVSTRMACTAEWLASQRLSSPLR